MNRASDNKPPSAAYMRQWIGSALVQVMASRLLGAKPLSKPVLGYCQLDPWEQTSVKFELKIFSFINIHEILFKIVCEIAAIWFRERWVKYRKIERTNDPLLSCPIVMPVKGNIE